MGPIILLDKSSLQAFSKDEIWLLFKHYTIVIPPILILEILADLKKKNIDADRAKKFVGSLANKLCPADCIINTHFQKLCIGSLLGHKVKMTGQIVRDGGVIIEDKNGKKGLFFDELPEWKYIRKWQRGDFSVNEEEFAERWREASHGFDLSEHQKYLNDSLPSPKPNICNFHKLKMVVDEFVYNKRSQYKSVLTFMHFLGLPHEIRKKVCWRWEMQGWKSFEEFAPYAFFCYKVHISFNFGLLFHLVGTRSTNVIDLGYLFYLPFSMVFCSGDKLHSEISTVLLRNNQEFVDRDVLKKDLQWLVNERMSLTENERKERSYDYGNYPPDNLESITCKLWKKYMKPWKPGSGNIKLTKEQKDGIMEHLKPFMDAIKAHDRNKQARF